MTPEQWSGLISAGVVIVVLSGLAISRFKHARRGSSANPARHDEDLRLLDFRALDQSGDDLRPLRPTLPPGVTRRVTPAPSTPGFNDLLIEYADGQGEVTERRITILGVTRM